MKQRESRAGETKRKEKGTRERVLGAALDVFAEKGFRQGTVREICSRAGVNSAAVNYHFQSKEGLYRFMIEDWHRGNRARFPLDGGSPGGGASARRGLMAFYVAALKRFFWGGGRLETAYKRARVMAWGMVSPPPCGPGLDPPEIKELESRARCIAADLLGPAPLWAALACADSCLGQLFASFLSSVRDQKTFQAFRDPALLEQTAAHMAAFALAGIRGAGPTAGSVNEPVSSREVGKHPPAPGSDGCGNAAPLPGARGQGEAGVTASR